MKKVVDQYAVRLPNGRWLNNQTDQTRWYRDGEQGVDKPRLLTKAGCRMAMGMRITPAMIEAHPPIKAAIAQTKRARELKDWSLGPRPNEFQIAADYCKAIGPDAYWKLVAKDGYKLVRFTLQLTPQEEDSHEE